VFREISKSDLKQYHPETTSGRVSSIGTAGVFGFEVQRGHSSRALFQST